MRFTGQSFRRKVVTAFMLSFVAAWALGGFAVWSVLHERLIGQAFSQMASTTAGFSLIIQEILESTQRSYLQGVAQADRARMEVLARDAASGKWDPVRVKAELASWLSGPRPQGLNTRLAFLDVSQAPERILLYDAEHLLGLDVGKECYAQAMCADKGGFTDFLRPEGPDARPRAVSAWYERFEALNLVLTVMAYRDELPELLASGSLQDRLSHLTVGRTGYFFVLDEDGTMLIHPRFPGENVRKLVDPVTGGNLHDGIIASIRSRQQDFGEEQAVGQLRYYLPDPDTGQPVQKILFYRQIPDLKWILGTVMETSEIEEPLHAAGVFFGITLLLSLLASLAVITRLTRPLFARVEGLTRAAQAMGEGRLDAPLPKPSSDELGVLVEAFASMSSRLAAHTAELEQAVDERTADLRASRSDMALFKAAVDASPAPIAIVDAEGRLEYANTAYNRLANLLGAETLGLPPIFLDPGRADPDKVAQVRAAVSVGSPWQGGMVAENPERRARRLKMAMAPVRDDLDRVHFVAVMEDVTERFNLEAELLSLATTDSLTGLPNRRRILERLEEELRLARRFGHEVSLIMIDLDRFKSINDTFGHAAGDKVLTEAARAMDQALREVDVAGRLGGEEFCVLLPYTGLAGAVALAERIRAKVEGLRVITPAGDYLRVTISAGVASSADREVLPTVESLLSKADAALYEAKRRGRNQVQPQPRPHSAGLRLA